MDWGNGLRQDYNKLKSWRGAKVQAKGLKDHLLVLVPTRGE
jgi:hypothetical protein